VKGIQAAIKLGKDVQGIASDLSKFFEAKDVVQQAANNPKMFVSPQLLTFTPPIR
jgi:hypothetical protein